MIGLLFVWATTALSNVSYHQLSEAVRLEHPDAPIVVHLKKLEEKSGPWTRYVLVGDSKSPQPARWEEPRVILYNEDGSSLAAFPGCPTSSHDIEFIEFRSEPNPVFTFHSLGFSRPEMDRPDCQGCHQGRPIWDSYPEWPGIYQQQAHSRYVGVSGLSRDAEDPRYQKFLRTRAKDPSCAYRLLSDLEKHYVRPRGERAPNTELSQLIGFLNYKRIAHQFTRLPQYQKVKRAALAALYDCKGFSTHLRPKHDPVELEDFRRKTRLAQKKSRNFFTRQYYHRELANLRYILEPYGIDFSSWSMSFDERDAFNLVMPSGTTAIFLSALLSQQDRDLKPFQRYQIVKDATYGLDYLDVEGFDTPEEKAASCAQLLVRQEAH